MSHSKQFLNRVNFQTLVQTQKFVASRSTIRELIEQLKRDPANRSPESIKTLISMTCDLPLFSQVSGSAVNNQATGESQNTTVLQKQCLRQLRLLNTETGSRQTELHFARLACFVVLDGRVQIVKRTANQQAGASVAGLSSALLLLGARTPRTRNSEYLPGTAVDCRTLSQKEHIAICHGEVTLAVLDMQEYSDNIALYANCRHCDETKWLAQACPLLFAPPMLSERELDEICQNSYCRRAGKGQSVYTEDDEIAPLFYIVRSGEFALTQRLQLTTVDGSATVESGTREVPILMSQRRRERPVELMVLQEGQVRAILLSKFATILQKELDAKRLRLRQQFDNAKEQYSSYASFLSENRAQGRTQRSSSQALQQEVSERVRQTFLRRRREYFPLSYSTEMQSLSVLQQMPRADGEEGSDAQTTANSNNSKRGSQNWLLQSPQNMFDELSSMFPLEEGVRRAQIMLSPRKQSYHQNKQLIQSNQSDAAVNFLWRAISNNAQQSQSARGSPQKVEQDQGTSIISEALKKFTNYRALEQMQRQVEGKGSIQMYDLYHQTKVCDVNRQREREEQHKIIIKKKQQQQKEFLMQWQKAYLEKDCESRQKKARSFYYSQIPKMLRRQNDRDADEEKITTLRLANNNGATVSTVTKDSTEQQPQITLAEYMARIRKPN